jgi:hypothetical protein
MKGINNIFPVLFMMEGFYDVLIIFYRCIIFKKEGINNCYITASEYNFQAVYSFIYEAPPRMAACRIVQFFSCVLQTAALFKVAQSWAKK